MTEEQIGNILRVIGTTNVSEEQRGSATADVLQLAAETFTKQVFTSLLNAKPNEIKREEEKAPQPRGRQKTGMAGVFAPLLLPNFSPIAGFQPKSGDGTMYKNKKYARFCAVYSQNRA